MGNFFINLPSTDEEGIDNNNETDVEVDNHGFCIIKVEPCNPTWCFQTNYTYNYPVVGVGWYINDSQVSSYRGCSKLPFSLSTSGPERPLLEAHDERIELLLDQKKTIFMIPPNGTHDNWILFGVGCCLPPSPFSYKEEDEDCHQPCRYSALVLKIMKWRVYSLRWKRSEIWQGATLWVTTLKFQWIFLKYMCDYIIVFDLLTSIVLGN